MKLVDHGHRKRVMHHECLNKMEFPEELLARIPVWFLQFAIEIGFRSAVKHRYAFVMDM